MCQLPGVFWADFLGGAALGLVLTGGYALARKGLQKLCRNIRSGTNSKRQVLQDDLQVLATSNNFQLRRSAIRLLIEKAVNENEMDKIVSACHSDQEELRMKGVTVLKFLVRKGKELRIYYHQQ
ncbi:uncharacterized protein LOC134196647 [Corticium candelabrum]|uniref:uncharacterized protein LOC134196647 n=1 Tax=Corticium candelabrum TaxID=121492 RepID=UPI002E271D81|nr:uncharacterized protein LOC134196647 [Corticium candelabrum]